ncbi:MAG: NAD-dependent epimerase/dehydratase family protein, partial [Myxococcales bacterium]|nr:NAD-dependent epimerase/dehydratase family protein [Myxococcales bacterium]
MREWSMIAFEQRLRVPVPARELHDWHLRPGAFERLGPPWERMRPLHAEPVAEGSRRVFEVRKGGLWLRWSAVHRDVVSGSSFTDVQEEGPFHTWIHRHRFEPESDTSSLLVDHVDYELPLGRLGQAVAGRAVAGEVARMFAYRHRITAGDLALHARFLDRPKLRVAVTGASGLIGQQLVSLLRTGGHEVLRLVRGDGEPAEDEVRWSLEEGVVDHERLEGIDAVVHLAG